MLPLAGVFLARAVVASMGPTWLDWLFYPHDVGNCHPIHLKYAIGDSVPCQIRANSGAI